MNQVIRLINDMFPYIVIILLLVADYFEYAKKNDPQVADKLKHIGTFAEWAVAYQDRQSGKSNQQKFDDAVASVLQQAEKSKIPVTEQTVKDAVEAKVRDRVTTSEPVQKPAEELPAPENKTVEQVAAPVEDDNAVLDDLKPKE